MTTWRTQKKKKKEKNLVKKKLKFYELFFNSLFAKKQIPLKNVNLRKKNCVHGIRLHLKRHNSLII